MRRTFFNGRLDPRAKTSDRPQDAITNWLNSADLRTPVEAPAELPADHPVDFLIEAPGPSDIPAEHMASTNRRYLIVGVDYGTTFSGMFVCRAPLISPPWEM